MKRVLACIVTLSVVHGLVATASGASQVRRTKLEFSHVTVTATPLHGNSAVAMTIVNRTGGPISLMSVTASVSQSNMMFYDDNMCQGNSVMRWLPNIFIGTNATQSLAYRNQGAMLSEVTEVFKAGKEILLQVKYSDFSLAQTVTVNARVVAPPKGLSFRMSTMKM